MTKKLSIVIPAFNEIANYKAGALDKVANYLKVKPTWEVIVVDDGSTDGSNQLIKKFVAKKSNWRFIQNSHQGKPTTVATGIQAAKNPLILVTDFDQATPLSQLEKLFPFIDQGYQVVIGSREVKGALRRQEPLYRHLMGKVFNLVVQLVAVFGIHDTQCGFKLFDARLAKKLFVSLKVYKPKKETYAFTGAFDVEVLFLANKWGSKIAEVPVHWTHAPTSRVHPLRDSVRMFVDVLRIRFNDILGRYPKHEIA